MFERPSRRLAGAAILGLLASLGIGTALTAQATSTPRTWTVMVGSQTKSMSVEGMRFLPGDVTIDAGDTVTWKAKSAEPHTVTFFAGGAVQQQLAPFNPGDSNQTTPQGTSVMDGTSYYNSGIMTTVPTGGDSGPLPPVPHFKSYSLTFPDAGTFTYYCLVHGIMMRGVVHVQPAGTPYPYTNKENINDALWQWRAIDQDGHKLWERAARESNNHNVWIGADDGHAMVMRFVRHTVYIHRGQKVHFLSNGMGPHTVTFGQEPQGPAVEQPSGNPKNYRGGNLSSGFLINKTFTVTFNKVGTFHYICALHDFMGMVGTVVVRK